ncbi:hypothetical protein CVT25_005091 [Psilocybe cyanescens]|uniref:SET domain-containing protein n=1 Tax=Psilocybe cyanescens TaxID=93625 RepID=A0A409XDY8_PSICY|nr:hypothetical protein CVT25_005091 [Psilocybe cyanescens]
MSNQLSALLEWCIANGIFIDSQIRIGSDEQGDIGVYATDSFISPKQTLVRIPKDAILSVRTCSLAGFIPFNPYGLGAQLSLSMALYAEMYGAIVSKLHSCVVKSFPLSFHRLKCRESKWFGYIDSFPGEMVDLPIFWGLDVNSQDALEALDWLTGTEAGKMLHGKNEDNLTKLVGTLSISESSPFILLRQKQEEIDNFYYDIAEPLLSRHLEASKPTLMGFHRAFSLVSSRAFLVDAYHGLSMVPIADAFNHSVDNQIHLESDYNVCPECGSLHECPHDRDDVTDVDTKPGSPKNAEDAHDSCYMMVTNAGIPPQAEIFNTYGETLSNSQLLNQYGFVLQSNDNARLSWTMYHIVQHLVVELFSLDWFPNQERRNIVTYMFQVLSALEVEEVESLLSSQSDLIYYEDTKEEHFFLKYEGLSHPLWAILFVLATIRYRHCNGNVDLDPGTLALQTLKLQTTLEALDGNDEDEEQHGNEALSGILKGSDKAAVDILQEIGSLCIALCDHRLRNNGKSDSVDEDLFKLLDELPPDNTRTRLAVSLVITERSILKSCLAGWQSLTRHVSSTLHDLG